jgi:CubicO group peptidase (beta-lactamase class C family)
MAVGTVGTGLHAQAPPAPAVAPGVAPAVSPDRGAADRVDSLFGRWNSTTTPGCAVAVARGGAVLLERAYGMADLERPARNTAATVFEAGSASKQFTAAAALLLVRDGKLGLDDPVRRHLPELPERAAQAGGRPATIRHLLSHTSGLRDWGEIAAAGGWPRGTRVYTQGDVLDIARRQSGLNFVPGSDYRYTNTGYTLLATVVERVSGESFAAFTRRRLFVPLGMAHTRWRDDHARAVPARALAYARGDDGEPRLTMPLENTVGHAGLLTTVGDLLRWNAHLERPDSAAGGPALVAALEAKARLTGGRVVPYGAGLFLTGYRGMREVSHGGSTAGYRAYVGRIGGSRAGSPAAGAPATGPVSVALLCNAADANAGRLAHAVADAFLPAAAPAVAAAPPATTAPADAGAGALAVRAGLYRDEASGDPLTVSADSAGLRIEGWTALVAVGPPAAGRFRSPGGEVEAAFDPGPPGRRATLRVAELEANGDTATLAAYRPTVPARPTPAALAAYVGAYAGPDVDATYAVAADGAGLALRRPRQAAVRLEPAYPDAFTAGGVGLVTFTRDAAGALTGLRLTLGRARGLAFARVARPADRRPGRPPA